MKASAIQADKPVFQKTELPCLYRYSSNGVYYALVKHEGKQKRASLQTTDKGIAKRKLADFQRDLGKVDPSQGRVTLHELCDRYLLTVQNQAPATLYRKKHIVARLLSDFPEVEMHRFPKFGSRPWRLGWPNTNSVTLRKHFTCYC